MDYAIKGETLESIANAIRQKTGKTEKMLPTKFADEITAITGSGSSGEKPTLFAPTIELNSITSILTITDNNGGFVEGYELYVLSTKITEVSSKTINLSDYIHHIQTIPVKVLAKGEGFENSDFSNIVEWVYYPPNSGTMGLSYELSTDGTYAICTGIGDAIETDIEIASEYDDVPVTDIGSSAFKNTSITSIIIREPVEVIYERAFENCRDLTRIEIPSSVTSIGYMAFSYTTGLKYVNITDIGAWCNVNANVITDPSQFPLQYAKDLYLNNELLTNLVIPFGITTLRNYLFTYCKSLTNVEIPSSVTSIGKFALYNCGSLKRVDFSKHTTIPVLDGVNAFGNTHADLQIKVPANLIDSWKAATNWANYADKIVTEFTNEV